MLNCYFYKTGFYCYLKKKYTYYKYRIFEYYKLVNSFFFSFLSLLINLLDTMIINLLLIYKLVFIY